MRWTTLLHGFIVLVMVILKWSLDVNAVECHDYHVVIFLSLGQEYSLIFYYPLELLHQFINTSGLEKFVFQSLKTEIH